MKHMVIPDTQVKPDSPTEHLRWAGQYAVEKKPDVIIHIGDHFDMPSLSTYDVGKKSFEGRRYQKDMEHSHDSLWVTMSTVLLELSMLIQSLRA